MQTQLAQLAQTVASAASTGREPAILAAINAVDALAYAYKGQGVYLPGVQQQLVRHRQLLEQAADRAANPMADFEDRMLTLEEAHRMNVPANTWLSQVRGRRVPPRAVAERSETERDRQVRIDNAASDLAYSLFNEGVNRTADQLMQLVDEMTAGVIDPEERQALRIRTIRGYNELVQEEERRILQNENLERRTGNIGRTSSGGATRSGGGDATAEGGFEPMTGTQQRSAAASEQSLRTAARNLYAKMAEARQQALIAQRIRQLRHPNQTPEELQELARLLKGDEAEAIMFRSAKIIQELRDELAKLKESIAAHNARYPEVRIDESQLPRFDAMLQGTY